MSQVSTASKSRSGRSRAPKPGSNAEALARLQEQVDLAWGLLRTLPGGAVPVIENTLRRVSTLLPCRVNRQPLSAQALAVDLRAALDQHHSEEIEVLMYTFLTNLSDVIQEDVETQQSAQLLAALRDATQQSVVWRTACSPVPVPQANELLEE